MMCIYFSVCLVLECPAKEAAVLMLAPLAIMEVIKVWRAQWKEICLRNPARLVHSLMIRKLYEWEGR